MSNPTTTPIEGIIRSITQNDPASILYIIFIISLSIFLIIPIYMTVIRRMLEGALESRREIEAKKAEKEISRLKNSIKDAYKNVGGDNLNLKSVNLNPEAEDTAGAQLAAKLQALEAGLFQDGKSWLSKPDGSPEDDWRKILISSTIRLRQETERLKGKSTTNLVLGVVFSTFAVIALIVLLLFYPSTASAHEVAVQLLGFLPRLTVAALLQVVAIFFLKMHASTENDLKINKNEITNIELRLAAGLSLKGGEIPIAIGEMWAKEERNFIISRKQKVASTMDIPQIESLMTLVTEALKRK